MRNPRTLAYAVTVSQEALSDLYQLSGIDRDVLWKAARTFRCQEQPMAQLRLSCTCCNALLRSAIPWGDWG